MLQVKNLNKIYTKGKHVVKAIDNLSFNVDSGDFISIVGQSGSGKSTLLLTLGGMLSPSSGSVSVAGHSLYNLKPKERALVRKNKIGFIFQTFNLIPYLTALQNVQLPLLLNGENEKKQHAKARALLERMGLATRLEHKPSELSVGQQQRVALARMLANDPEIILADEPTGNLDSDTSSQVINFIKEINQEGKTIILITHDMKIAGQAKRTMKIVEGKFSNTLLHRLVSSAFG